MMVSMMVINCFTSPPPYIDVFGQDLDGEASQLKLRNIDTGAYYTFTLSGTSAYWFRMQNFNPVLPAIGNYALEYGTRELFNTTLQCPIGLSGIYYIDSGSTRDTYNDALRKIPDPTIRTALIGE